MVVDIDQMMQPLLKGYKKFKAKTIGVKPAKNLAKFYKGKKLLYDYFNIRTAKKIKNKYGKAKIITATNVSHLQDLFCHRYKYSLIVILIEAHLKTY